MVVDVGRHLGVQLWQDVSRPLDDGDVDATVDEVLRGLQTYVSRTADDRLGRMDVIDEPAHPQSILHRAHCHDARIAHGHRIRDDRTGAWREDQLVIALLVFGSIHRAADDDLPGRTIDGDHLAPHTHIDIESGGERSGSLKGQFRLVLYRSSDVVRKSAIGVRNISCALEDHELRILVQPPQPSRGRCSSGHPSDYDYLHGNTRFYNIVFKSNLTMQNRYPSSFQLASAYAGPCLGAFDGL